MTRRFGEPVVSGQRYIHRPGVYAILQKDGHLLVTFQSAPSPEYQLPGGGIDAGEQPTAALHREVFEETGWRIATPRKIGAFRRFTYMPEYDLWAEKLCHIYLSRPILPYGPPSEPLHSAVWVPIAKAASVLANSGDRHFVSRLLA